MNLVRKLFAKLGLVKLVVLEDHDGELTLRLKRKNVLGKPCAHRMPFGIRIVELADDGIVPNGSYVKKWHEYK